MEHLSLLDLFLRAREGDRSAFDRLVGEFSHRLRDWIKSRMGAIVRRACEMDDIFQETCLSAFLSIRRFEWRGERSFIRWLKKIAQHSILNLRRREEAQKRKGARGIRLDEVRDSSAGNGAPASVDPRDSRMESPSKTMERLERSRRLRRAWKALPSVYRLVLKLARIDGLPIKGIAVRLGTSPTAVSMRLLRATRALGEIYGPDGSSLRLPPDCDLNSPSGGEEPSSVPARLKPRRPAPPRDHARPTETRMCDDRGPGGASSSLMEMPSTP